MTIVEMTTDIHEVIGKQISACALLYFLRNKLIKDQIAVSQHADGHEARRISVVRRDLSEIDVVNQQKSNEEKRLCPHPRLS